MLAKRIIFAGYEAFKEGVLGITGKERINVYFTGSKGEDGVSWCPDCVAAESHVEAAVEKFATAERVFVVVDVGDRTYWKDLKNPFRTDKDIHISVIPTIIRWKGPQRLEGEQLLNDELLEMFFTDDE